MVSATNLLRPRMMEDLNFTLCGRLLSAKGSLQSSWWCESDGLRRLVFKSEIQNFGRRSGKPVNFLIVSSLNNSILPAAFSF